MIDFFQAISTEWAIFGSEFIQEMIMIAGSDKHAFGLCFYLTIQKLQFSFKNIIWIFFVKFDATVMPVKHNYQLLTKKFSDFSFFFS